MTAQDLKNSILQLAMQGKLVEQRAEEGTAKELIEQIEIEKERLIEEGKIRREKPLPKITEEEIPFEIPESWEWVRWGNLANSIQYGYNAPAKSQGDIRIVRISDIQNNTVNWSTVPYCQISEKEIPMYILSENDLLFARTGGTVGKSYLVTNLTERAIFAGYLIRSDYNKRLSPQYLKYFMESPLYWLQLQSGTTKTAQPNCNGKTLSKMIIPIPPINEQRRVVEKLDELIHYIEKYDKAYSKLQVLDKKFSEDMQKSILQYAVQGKLVEQRPEEGTGEELYWQIQAAKEKLIKEGKIKKEKILPEITGDEIPFDIPDSWKWVRLGEIILFQGGYAFKSDTYIEKSDNQVIRLGNVKNNKLLIHEKEVFVSDDLAEQLAAYRIHENDILVSMTGTRRKKDYFFTVLVGKDDVLKRKLYLNQRVGCFRTIVGIYHNYLLFVLQNNIIKNIIFAKETGTANQGNLGSEDMKRFVYIPLPPYEEQKRIVKELEKIMRYCKCLRKD